MNARSMTKLGMGAPALAAIGIATLALAGCDEIPQDAAKPFAGKEETQSYAGGKFNGDKALYEKTLAGRADTMNEYLITEDAKTEPVRAVAAAEGSSPAANVK
ncbi:MAG TPA: hypothetical protein VFK48_14205 [Usitatibacter sp.]|nr:hypothetical protein [Usitatibacter sp.]